MCQLHPSSILSFYRHLYGMLWVIMPMMMQSSLPNDSLQKVISPLQAQAQNSISPIVFNTLSLVSFHLSFDVSIDNWMVYINTCISSGWWFSPISVPKLVQSTVFLVNIWPTQCCWLTAGRLSVICWYYGGQQLVNRLLKAENGSRISVLRKLEPPCTGY